MIKKNWNILKADKVLVNKLAFDLNVSNEIASLLVLRGITNYENAKCFFRPSLDAIHDPFLMKGMKIAVNRLVLAKAKRENILVYGDYDVDGTTSVSMMYLFLLNEGLNVKYYIPDRYDEGYGVSKKGIDFANTNNISLIITLDCGIRAVEQVKYANNYNIDLIICDHHNPGKKLPEAHTILNPKQLDCKYPFKELSGCGVGFKLIHGYSNYHKIKFEKISRYLDLLAISIISDMVPINGENRVFAFHGLKKINKNPSVGIQSLINISKKQSSIHSSDILFGIAPLINAAGRISHAKYAVELLIEESPLKAKKYSEEILNNNIERKDLEKSITNEALEMVDKKKFSSVVFSNSWHKGVVGIVASRLIDVYYKPTIVLSEHNGMLTGSARSVKGFDIYKAIEKCSYLCDKFGGHKYAAGLSIKKKNIDIFIAKFEEIVSKSIKPEQLIQNIDIDLKINLLDIDNKFYRILKQFSPFGPGNKTPVFITKNLCFDGEKRFIGSDKSHVKLKFARENLSSIDAIGFGFASFFLNHNNESIDICYSLNENTWMSKTTLQINLIDVI
ncbi:MAG: single-stranded-DNA-specific exonuclease RecJ [Flavobacteriales bacterium]|nr:single-stranded-DNA-specific exonuclease RecJ [Flavobacteriales bacterium]